MKQSARLAVPLCAALLVSGSAYTPAFAAGQQDPPQQQDPQQTQDAGGGRGGAAREPVIRPYERVITKDAASKAGVFGRIAWQQALFN